MHASGDSPWHSSAKHDILEACFFRITPFRSMLLTLQSGLQRFTPRAQSVPAYAQVLRHSSMTLSRHTRITWWNVKITAAETTWALTSMQTRFRCSASAEDAFQISHQAGGPDRRTAVGDIAIGPNKEGAGRSCIIDATKGTVGISEHGKSVECRELCTLIDDRVRPDASPEPRL